MAFSYVRGTYFNSDGLMDEVEITDPIDGFTASSRYYYNRTKISALTVSNYSFFSNSGEISSGTVQATGTLYVTGGAASDIIVEPAGWLGMTIDAAHVDDICFFVSARSTSGDESVEFSYQNTNSVSDLTIPGFCGLAVEGVGSQYDNFNVSDISINGRLELDGVSAENISVLQGGGLLLHSQTTVKDLTVRSGGNVYIKNGSDASAVVFTGDLRIGGMFHLHNYKNTVPDSTVSVTGTLIFDLTEDGTAEVMVDDLNAVVCDSFEICVSSTGGTGEYTLACGASGFNRAITVSTAAGKDLGTLAVGGVLVSDNRTYGLSENGGVLKLTVNEAAPVSSVAGDLNGDGRADVIMSITQPGHGAEGATGAWLIQNDQTAAWGNLSQRNPGWEIFGTGVTTAGKAANDVYVKSTGNVIGAWVTGDSGNVTGWETVGEFDDATRILGLGDFNADGQTDLLLRNVNGAVGCFFTSGDTTGWNYFQSLGDEWKIAAVGDLNGDGRDDVVLKHDAGFAGSWLTQSDGTMVWANLDTLPEGFAVIGAGDFDGDGVDDVLLQKDTYYGAWLVEAGSVKSWFGLGDLGDVTVEQIADFDGDGKDDLRIRTSAGDLGAQLVRAADTLEWRYYGSVGAEWSTRLAAI